MMTAFFSGDGKPKVSIINPSLVPKLTRIRLSKYNIVTINNNILETDYDDIKSFIKELGNNILKANAKEANDFNNIKDIRAKFIRMTDNFIAQSNKYAIAVYAAQLLQYYTILCDNNFHPQQDFRNFDTFLSANTETFGDASQNVFVIEYKLIKIYNELCNLVEAACGNISPIIDSEKLSVFLIEHLQNLHVIVSTYKCNAPDNIFSHYLSFVANYASAKALELNYTMLAMNSDASVEEAQPDLSQTQQIYLANAKESLQEIEVLTRDFKESSRFLKGLEFGLGQDVLNKLPVKNFNDVNEHVKSLLA